MQCPPGRPVGVELNAARFRLTTSPAVDSLLEGGDPYFLLADYAAYVECQDRVGEAYRDRASWARKSIRNVAQMGKFSTDRTIREYAQAIWNVKPVSPGL